MILVCRPSVTRDDLGLWKKLLGGFSDRPRGHPNGFDCLIPQPAADQRGIVGWGAPANAGPQVTAHQKAIWIGSAPRLPLPHDLCLPSYVGAWDRQNRHPDQQRPQAELEAGKHRLASHEKLQPSPNLVENAPESTAAGLSVVGLLGHEGSISGWGESLRSMASWAAGRALKLPVTQPFCPRKLSSLYAAQPDGAKSHKVISDKRLRKIEIFKSPLVAHLDLLASLVKTKLP